MARKRLLAALTALATAVVPLAWACPCPPSEAVHEHDCCAQEGPALTTVPDCCRSVPAPAAATQTPALQVPAPGPGLALVVPAAVECHSALVSAPRVVASPPTVLRI